MTVATKKKKSRAGRKPIPNFTLKLRKTVTLDADVQGAIQKYADENATTFSTVVNEILRDYFFTEEE